VLVLNELEAAERVERRRDPPDRRRHLVEITPEGLAALERAEQAQATIEDDVLGALKPAERNTLRALLHKALAPDDQQVGTINTAQRARCDTRLGTEPSIRRGPDIPRLPTTIISAPTSSATASRASAGSPLHT
jgi:hypothetical protein